MQPKPPSSGTAISCHQVIDVDAQEFKNGDTQIIVMGGVFVRPRDVLRIKNRWGVHRLTAGNVNHRVRLGSLVDLVYPKSAPHRVNRRK